MKTILALILTISIFTSCEHLQYTVIDYHQMSLDYENKFSDTVTPIEEKQKSSQVLFFTTCLEELLNEKVIELYNSQSENSFVLSDSKDAYITNRENWQNQNQINSEAILNDCGSENNCDVDVFKFLIEETRTRIQLLENILNNQ